MKASNLHLLGVDFQHHVGHVELDDAARRQNTKERRRADGACGPQRGSPRAFAYVTVDGVWRQNRFRVQPAGIPAASGSRWTGAISRIGPHRSGRCWRFSALLAHLRARCRATFGAHGGRLDPTGNAHNRRGRAAKAAVSGICTRGFKSGSSRGVAGAQSRARDVCERTFGVTRTGGSRHRPIEGRTRAARICTAREFSAFAITHQSRCARPVRVAATSANVLRVGLAATLSLSAPSSASRLPSFNLFRHPVAIV